MAFTDDDLKRLKELFKATGSERGGTMLSLLARLEAAEKICVWAKGISPRRLDNAWRKAAGEKTQTRMKDPTDFDGHEPVVTYRG